MKPSTVATYAGIADSLERDPVSSDQGRATVPMGRGFNLYKRFNPDAQYVTVTTLQGKEVELTRIQANVYDLGRTYIDNGTVTMREMADQLHVAPSTIWRALVKLASFGLIGYLTGRGRWNRTVIFSRGKNDGMERFQQAAKATVAKWRKATEARFSRLRDSVAPYILGRGIDSLTEYFLVTSSKGATLKREWRSDELVDIV
jgi:hypothetical protein